MYLNFMHASVFSKYSYLSRVKFSTKYLRATVATIKFCFSLPLSVCHSPRIPVPRLDISRFIDNLSRTVTALSCLLMSAQLTGQGAVRAWGNSPNCFFRYFYFCMMLLTVSLFINALVG